MVATKKTADKTPQHWAEALLEARDAIELHGEHGHEWNLMRAFEAIRRAELGLRESGRASVLYEQVRRTIDEAMDNYVARRLAAGEQYDSSAMSHETAGQVVRLMLNEFGFIDHLQSRHMKGEMTRPIPSCTHTHIYKRVGTTLGIGLSTVRRAWTSFYADLPSGNYARVVVERVSKNAAALKTPVQPTRTGKKKTGMPRMDYARKKGRRDPA